MYLGILAHIGIVPLAVTTSASIDFMRKPAGGVDLLARTRLLKLGKNLAVGDVVISSKGSDLPVARASLTYALPRKP
jgi:acyl-coenzyme A thioesterase PaaI-like protein